jgi:hypothetical protein
MKSTRPLLIAVIVMGVLVVLATSVVIVKVVMDITGGGRHAETSPAGLVPSGPAAVKLTTQMLNEPAGSHILSITGVGDRLSVLITGGGPDRILFLDPATGLVTGQIMVGK